MRRRLETTADSILLQGLIALDHQHRLCMDDLRGEFPDPAVRFDAGLLHQRDHPLAAFFERAVLSADGLRSRAVTRESSECVDLGYAGCGGG
jgi:hypothetical protein